MNTNPMVSVVMPCYNDGRYIQESVASVKAQTYPEIELIIIDDGSDDSHTIATLDALAKEDGIRVLHASHVGPSAARNAAIQEARGKYILPLDADDTINTTYIEKAVKILEGHRDTGVVYCEADLFGAQSGKWDLPAYSFESMLFDNIVFVTALFSKADWEKVGGFNENMKAGMEDYDFWLSILGEGKKIEQIPEVLFHYRIKDSSRTSQFQQDPSRIKETYRQLFDNHRDFILAHADVLIPAMRDVLIDQLYLRRVAEQQAAEYQQQARAIVKVREIPVLGKILQKIYHLFVK
ncbi:MAG: glycosyltransferase [Clostridia bacterium]|nr:glycosyltransferase [Clostridia bacterium]